jgi:hypothetical protein
MTYVYERNVNVKQNKDHDSVRGIVRTRKFSSAPTDADNEDLWLRDVWAKKPAYD